MSIIILISDGLRAQKMVDVTRGNTATRTITHHEWDGQNLVMDLTGGGDVKAVYLRGASLIAQQIAGQLYYYTFNGHGDVVQRVGQTGAAGPKYKYDAFGNQRGTSETDPNPFRYCGEYYDAETGTVYLRNRNYDTATGRFSSEDTHWNAENRIYGDNPQRINEEPERFKYAKTVVGNEEKERGKGTLLPNVSAIRQSGNLYEYGMGNPVSFGDATGDIAFLLVTALIGAAVGAVAGGIIAAANGENVWAGIAIGAVAGGLIGLGAGAVAGVVLGGAATASATAVSVGVKTITLAVSTGGITAAFPIIEQNITNAMSNTTVLGSYIPPNPQVNPQNYVEVGQQISARVFNTPTVIWDQLTEAQQWAYNLEFLNGTARQSTIIQFSVNAYNAKQGTAFYNEIQFLLEKGYRIVNEGWRMVK